MKLERCSGCGGFVPSSAAACSHCRSTRVRLGAIATVIGAGAIGFTLMACYGGPPCGEAPCQNTTPSTEVGDAGALTTPLATSPDAAH